MKKVFLTTLLFVFVALCNTYAQKSVPDSKSTSGKEQINQWDIEGGGERKDTIKNPYNTLTNNNYIKDSAYYADVVKKHGWFVGVGKKMTLKEASHRSCYYKLSKKNKAGNWTLMEAFDGYGNPTTNHTIRTYLVNHTDEDDLSANKDWKEKLQDVCKWEFIADPSGKEVIQERAYNAEKEVVFLFNPVKVGDREYIGNYTDAWGMPIFLRTDTLGNDLGYANFVHITRNEDGYETLFSYVDRMGYSCKNKDGAYKTKKEYDAEGHQIMEASLNLIGENMTDDWGNCGWEHHFYKTYNESFYYSPEWTRMKMPKSSRSTGENVYGYRIFPDQYGRDTLVMFIDQNGKPDVNEKGIHAIRTQYNEHGLWTYIGRYDINGNLYADDSGIAQVYNTFNSNGDLTEARYQDEKGNYVIGPLGWCIEKDSFDAKGKLIHEVDYALDSMNNLFKQYEYTRDDAGNITKKWYNKNKQRVDSFDTKGRNVLMAWYDLEGNPIENKGLHKAITIYDDENNIETEKWLDKNDEETLEGNDDRNYSKAVTVEDLNQHITTYYRYFYNLPYEIWQKQFDDTNSSTLAQWDLTPYGEHARVGWWNNLHYKCEVDYTMYGEIRTIVGKNEFDEPSYIAELRNNGNVYYYSNPKAKGGRQYFDEDGKEIPSDSMEIFKDSLPKAFCIEVTDTAFAYPLGLRNGDIILSFGDWTVSENLRENIDYFYLETILKANETKHITVLRHHPERNTSEILHLNLPQGRTSDLGFYPHKIYYTKKEKTRLLSACDNYNLKLSSNEIPQYDTTILMAVQTKGDFEGARLYHLPSYDIKDPGIVLYASETWSNGKDTWSMKESIAQWEKQKMFYIKGAELYITQDMDSTRHIIKWSKGFGGMKFIPIRVNQNLYDEALSRFQSIDLEEKDKAVEQTATLQIDPKQLVGKWKWNGKKLVDDMPLSYTSILKFAKDGSVTINDNVILELELSHGVKVQIVASIQTSAVRWSVQDNIVHFDTENAIRKGEITYIDFVGANETQKETLMQHFAQEGEELKNYIINSLGFIEIIDNHQLQIVEFEKKKFNAQGLDNIPFMRL